jgi:transposase
MIRYTKELKDKVVTRLLPPGECELGGAYSRALGINPATLERWRSQALAAPARLTLRSL